MFRYFLWLVLLIVLSVIVKAYKMTHFFQKWSIPQYPDLPFLGFMCSHFFPRLHMNEISKQIYNLDPEAKYVGCYLFLTPIIMLRDHELIKSILVKNFDHFTHHKVFIDETVDPLFGGNLAFLNGDRWREVRNLLSPAFTSSKMRTMYVLMSRCAENFVEIFLERSRNVEAVNIKDAFTRYTNDVIATCAFGIEVDSLRNPKNEFYIRGNVVAPFQGLKMLKVMLIRAFPTLTQKMGLRIISQKDTEFFVNVIEATMRARKEHDITRPDMLQLMMDARENVNLDLLEMTAQAFVFFLAGFESTAVQMCLIAHELAVNPGIQEKLQAEIDGVMRQCGGKLNYELVNNMTYLDAVFNESLRMHPSPFLNRMCTKEFELPPTLPRSKPYRMKPGMEIMIPVAGIHADPKNYENPEVFNPERFFAKKSSHCDVTSLGFGLGPRMCIGNRFAILETKVLLVKLLSRSSLVPCHKTCVPLEYCPSNFSPTAKGGFWLRVEPRS